MKYLGAYALAWLSGNEQPSVADIEKIFKSVGAEFERAKASALVEGLAGKKLEEVITKGLGKIGSVGSGAGAAATTGAAHAQASKPAEVEKQAEEEVADAMEGGISLFGDDEW